MRLLLSKPRGFCAGVVRAIRTVERALELFGAPIFVKHEIVHNRHVVDRLKRKGAIFIENIDDVPEGARIIYSAHGVSPEVRKQAQKRKLIEIDATCGLVTRVHSAVRRFASRGYAVVLIGHKRHVEVVGTAAEAKEAVEIVESVDDVKDLPFPSDAKIFFVTQTTLSLDDIKPITDALYLRYPQIETMPSSSVCYATTNRQMALGQITEDSDLILVVGDPKSSNSNRLKEVAHRRHVTAYLINDEREIDPQWLLGVKTIGLTAGASTPEDIVQKCIQRLIELGVSSVEDVEYTKEEVTFQLPKLVVDPKILPSSQSR